MHGCTPRSSPSRGRTSARLAAATGLACGLFLSLPGALGQSPAPTTTPAPASEPKPTVTVPRIIVSPSTAPTLEPVRPNLPPIAAQDLSLSANPPLLREGAFISGARCQLVKGKSGRWYAIFDADGTGRMIPPMIVMENANLAAMERVAGREPSGTRVKISGRVTVYRDRNFILPSSPPLLERAAAADPDAAANTASREASAAAANTPTPNQPARAASEPSIEQIIADLDKAVGTRKSASATSARKPDAEAPPRFSTVQEPTEPGITSGYLTARQCRIIRGSDGYLAAVVDTSSSGRTESPLTLLPCQNLTNIEAILDSNPAGAEATPFTLTGDVYLYKGRRYLLPAMYTLVRPSDNIMPAH